MASTALWLLGLFFIANIGETTEAQAECLSGLAAKGTPNKPAGHHGFAGTITT